MKRYFIPILLLGFIIAGCKKSNDGGGTPPPAAQNDITSIDNIVNNFKTTYSIPGVSIAITKNGKLVYAKSYGTMSASDATEVKNTSLYRIASLSKPITAVGIMKLLEANKLTLDSKVFGTGNILGNDYPSSQLPYVSDITVGQLLHHTTGAWPNDGTDPMFQQLTYNHAQLIKWTLDTYSATGSRGVYKYSNFGYCILGRVIEKLSGKSYEQFMKDEVLSPCGISDMTISGNTIAERKNNEAIYTGQNGENPYTLNVTRMDSHGGWLATATDLARFMVKVDGFSSKTDILQSSTISTMITPSAGNANYACGWSVNSANNWWHTGSLPGTASELVRAGNGFCWVILCNSKSNNSNFFTALDGLLWPVVNNTSTPWQDIDQF